MKESVRLARQARERFLARHPHITYTPLIAASAGPYGAYLADGSEYMGDYLLSSQALKAFHQPRLEALLAAQPDLIAFETIPSRQEAQAIAELLAAYPKALAWVSFSCKDGRHISDGERIADCVKDIAGCRQLVAVGVNCTPPEFMESLIQEIKQATEIPIVVYPNSGEGWDAQRACWLPATSSGSLTEMAVRWKTAGARLIGGCCRTGVGDIERLRKKLLPSI
jgi:homocysteine S-methyltransferase